jgi:alkanesulfonate monooxygenase
LVGDYDTVARRIVEFTEVGIETFLLQFQPFEREMQLFADQVMPRVCELQPGGERIEELPAISDAWNYESFAYLLGQSTPILSGVTESYSLDAST